MRYTLFVGSTPTFFVQENAASPCEGKAAFLLRTAIALSATCAGKGLLQRCEVPRIRLRVKSECTAQSCIQTERQHIQPRPRERPHRRWQSPSAPLAIGLCLP